MRKRGSIKDLWRLEVEWEDSHLSLGGWEPARHMIAELHKAAICHSVGFVLADDKRGVVLAGSVNGSRATGMVFIPVSAIRRRRRLR